MFWLVLTNVEINNDLPGIAAPIFGIPTGELGELGELERARLCHRQGRPFINDSQKKTPEVDMLLKILADK